MTWQAQPNLTDVQKRSKNQGTSDTLANRIPEHMKTITKGNGVAQKDDKGLHMRVSNSGDEVKLTGGNYGIGYTTTEYDLTVIFSLETGLYNPSNATVVVGRGVSTSPTSNPEDPLIGVQWDVHSNTIELGNRNIADTATVGFDVSNNTYCYMNMEISEPKEETTVNLAWGGARFSKTFQFARSPAATIAALKSSGGAAGINLFYVGDTFGRNDKL